MYDATTPTTSIPTGSIPATAVPTVAVPGEALFADVHAAAPAPRRRRRALAAIVGVAVVAGAFAGLTLRAADSTGDVLAGARELPAIGGELGASLPGIGVDELGELALPATEATIGEVATDASGTSGVPSGPAPAPAPQSPAPAPTVPPAPTTTQPPAPVGPEVLSVSGPASVLCKPADPVPYITISWQVAGADEVTLSIDGPGIYKSYPGADGSDAVPFACGMPHSYTITAISGASTHSQTIVVASVEMAGPMDESA